MGGHAPAIQPTETSLQKSLEKGLMEYTTHSAYQACTVPTVCTTTGELHIVQRHYIGRLWVQVEVKVLQ
jgi:hypothetical protein